MWRRFSAMLFIIINPLKDLSHCAIFALFLFNALRASEPKKHFLLDLFHTHHLQFASEEVGGSRFPLPAASWLCSSGLLLCWRYNGCIESAHSGWWGCSVPLTPACGERCGQNNTVEQPLLDFVTSYPVFFLTPVQNWTFFRMCTRFVRIQSTIIPAWSLG